MEKLSDEKMLQIRAAIHKAVFDEFCEELQLKGIRLEIDVKSPTLEQDLIAKIKTGHQFRAPDQQWIIYAVAANLISDKVIKCLLENGYSGFWWSKDTLILTIDSGAISLDTIKSLLKNRNFTFTDTLYFGLLQRMIDHKLPEKLILSLLRHHRRLHTPTSLQMVVDAVVANKIKPSCLKTVITYSHYEFGEALEFKIIQYTINGELDPVFLKLMMKKHHNFSSFNEEVMLNSGIDFMVQNYLAEYHPELLDMM